MEKPILGEWYIHVLTSFLFLRREGYHMGEKLNQRRVYNYELEYITSSEGGMYINDVYRTVKTGDIIFRRPGETTQGVMPYTCYMIVFGVTAATIENQDNFIRHGNDVIEEDYSHPVLDVFSSIYHSQPQENFGSLFERIHRTYLNEKGMNDMRRRIYLEHLLLYLYDQFQKEVDDDISLNPYQQKIKRVKALMLSSMGQKLYLEDLAFEASLSVYHFNRVFKAHEGVTPMTYLTRLRINKSKTLLLSTRKNMTEIAYNVGFENSSYYSNVFKRYTNMSPTMYRELFSYDR
jgi:AraC family transcriptional regulator